MSRKDLIPIDIYLVNNANIDSGEDTPVTNFARDSFNNSRRPSLKISKPSNSESEYGELDSPGSPWTPAPISAPSTTTSTASSIVPSLASLPTTPGDKGNTPTRQPFGNKPPLGPSTPSGQGVILHQPPTGFYNTQVLHSPVLKVFNQQPFRFFPSFHKKSKKEMKAESLDMPSPSQPRDKAHRMPRNRSFAFSTEAAHLNRSADSSESSFPMQPIYVFHNMNTMQQRLGIPYYTSSHSGSKKDGKEAGASSNILRNYYLVHGQQMKTSDEANPDSNNISPIPLQTPRELFDAHHTMNSTGGSTNSNASANNTNNNANTANSSGNTNAHNISSGNINIAAAREKLLLKYNLFAHNIASAGETHLSLLYETCLVQYEDILLAMTDFVPTSVTDATIAVDGMTLKSNASNEHMKAIFNRMGMSTSSMSLLEDYSSIRVENSLSYHSSSSSSADDNSRVLSRSASSKSFSDDEDEAPNGLIINVSPFDYDRGSGMIVIMRFLDIVSAYSEVLQLQSKEDEALVLLLRGFEKTMSFVNNHLPAAPSAGVSVSSSNSVSMPVYHEMAMDLTAGSASSVNSDLQLNFFIKLDELILLEMHQSLTRLLKEINAGNEVKLDMTVYQLLEKLNNDAYMHIMYAVANNIRRLCVLLKCTGKLAQAHIAAKTTVHIFQSLSNSYEEHRADLISAYSLLASILDERGQLDESLKIDHKAMELAAQLQASTIRLGFPVSSSNPPSAVCTPLGELPQKH